MRPHRTCLANGSNRTERQPPNYRMDKWKHETTTNAHSSSTSTDSDRHTAARTWIIVRCVVRLAPLEGDTVDLLRCIRQCVCVDETMEGCSTRESFHIESDSCLVKMFFIRVYECAESVCVRQWRVWFSISYKRAKFCMHTAAAMWGPQRVEWRMTATYTRWWQLASSQTAAAARQLFCLVFYEDTVWWTLYSVFAPCSRENTENSSDGQHRRTQNATILTEPNNEQSSLDTVCLIVVRSRRVDVASQFDFVLFPTSSHTFFSHTRRRRRHRALFPKIWSFYSGSSYA